MFSSYKDKPTSQRKKQHTNTRAHERKNMAKRGEKGAKAKIIPKKFGGYMIIQ
jgi:hypothetical protein